MSPFVLCAVLLAATPSAVDGAYQEAPADASMWLARRAPLPLQPLALMALDTALPLGGVLLAVGAGAGVGGVLAGAILPSAGAGAPVPVMAAAGAAVGAALLGGAAWLVMDLAWSPRHGAHVRPSRILFLLPLVVPVLLAGGIAAAWGLVGPRTDSRAGDLLATAALVMGLGVLQAGAVTTSVLGLLLGRVRADHDQGSALWEPAR